MIRSAIVAPSSRSIVNITFRCIDRDGNVSPALEKDFATQALARQRRLLELPGHRSVGGLRASIYNAMPMEGVAALIEFVREFDAAVVGTL